MESKKEQIKVKFLILLLLILFNSIITPAETKVWFEQNITEASKTLHCDSTAIKAVIMVESSGRTVNKQNKPLVSKGNWGLFQISINSFKICGFKSKKEFKKCMSQSVDCQFDSFIKFIQNRNLSDALRTHNWRKFARIYNGSQYRKLHYDSKLRFWYNKLNEGK